MNDGVKVRVEMDWKAFKRLIIMVLARLEEVLTKGLPLGKELHALQHLTYEEKAFLLQKIKEEIFERETRLMDGMHDVAAFYNDCNQN